MRSVVFVPTYNEAPNLERLVAEIRRISPSSEILVVDDQSPDGTGEIADRLAAADPEVHVMHRPPPRGRGVAGRDGYVEALRMGADVVLEMDADFSHPPELIPEFWKKIEEGADVVLGSRFVPGGTDHDRTWARRVITVLANTYIRIVLGVPVGDCNSGFRCFRRSALEAIRPETLTSVGPSIVQEVLFRVHRAGASIVEIPLEFVDRKDGDSKLGLGLLFDGYVMILRLKLMSLFGKQP
ncbi:MAG: polyprenol monophosphomannose synthase [Gemmatimonadetes bacterium]|nr:polyprenol monophosphomannose synthase [Gemmatimonadota bacterium]